jgi:trafficking protein particle complex subunit 8
VIKEVVPAMEKRIAALNVTVTQSRKGVKNVIKSWWRKPREAEERNNTQGGGGGVQYRYDQIENQILTLADATFVMKDYETALSMFRLVKDDFKADKALLYQGSCHIMIAICLVVMDSDLRNTKREAESSLREALLLFQTAQQQQGNRRKEVTLATRMATHTAFLLADVLSNTGRHREAADVLVRASRDESYLSSAILLEQASWLFKANTLDRKFAFHVILSGIKFHSCQLEQHAVRCFSAARYLYEGTNWVHIQDYIQAHLAKNLTSEGNVEGALRCYLNIVSAGRQSSDRQARFITDFINTFMANPDKLPQGGRHKRGGCGSFFFFFFFFFCSLPPTPI